MEQGDSVMLTTIRGKGMAQVNQKRKGKIQLKLILRKRTSVTSVKKKVHMKKDCFKFNKWFEDKGNTISFVSYESNLVNLNINTW